MSKTQFNDTIQSYKVKTVKLSDIEDIDGSNVLKIKEGYMYVFPVDDFISEFQDISLQANKIIGSYYDTSNINKYITLNISFGSCFEQLLKSLSLTLDDIGFEFNLNLFNTTINNFYNICYFNFDKLNYQTLYFFISGNSLVIDIYADR